MAVDALPANVVAAQICGFVKDGEHGAANELLCMYLADRISGGESACQALQDIVGALIGVAAAVAPRSDDLRELGLRLLGVSDA